MVRVGTLENLQKALAVERSRLFVGREEEKRIIKNWLAETHPPTEVIVLSGMGGIGKSALMLQFLDLATDKDIQTIWLDGRICPETPAGFLESLQNFVTQRPADMGITSPLMETALHALSQNKTLLCIDNYEYIRKIEGWLRSVFLPQLSATGLLIVIAARPNVVSDWQNEMAWRNRVKAFTLSPLSKREVHHFFFQSGLKSSDSMDRLMVETQGLPLAMALTAERIQLAQYEELEDWPLSTRISADLLREVATPGLKQSIDILCILPQATAHLMGRLQGTAISPKILQQLSEISFIRPTAGGFALHDVARSYLVEDFFKRDPDYFKTLQQLIIKELAKELHQSNREDKQQLASMLLATVRNFFQLESNMIISTNPDLLQMRPFRESDLPYLHQIMTEEVNEYTLSPENQHALLDTLAHQFPENIHVFRSKEGIPLAYTVGLLLYNESISILESFFPGVLEAAFPKEISHMKKQTIEEATTYYQLLTGVTLRHADYSFYELVGVLIADMILHNSAGLRFVIITNYTKTYDLLKSIGTQTRPLAGLPKSHPLYGASIHEQDYRGVEMGDHILTMLNASSPDAVQLNERDIKTALSLIQNKTLLGATSLAHQLGCTGEDIQSAITQILSEDPPIRMSQRSKEVIQLLCTNPHHTPEMAAEHLHISRATFYRRRGEAMKEIKTVLMDQFSKRSV
jgi:hypothetical protein